MKKQVLSVLGACIFAFGVANMSEAADCFDDLCGRWEGQTTVANNEDPEVPFIEVGMVIEITAIEEASTGGRLFVGTVQFLGMSGPPTPFDLTGIFIGHVMKASTAGTVVSALLSWDGATMSGYYLDTLLIPGTRAHPQTGKFVLVKETE